MFKRRDRLPIWQSALRFLWPRGGWGRAAIYVKHRVRRLPDTPRKISRGIMVGVFTTFTPLYGIHFVLAALLTVLALAVFLRVTARLDQPEPVAGAT